MNKSLDNSFDWHTNKILTGSVTSRAVKERSIDQFMLTDFVFHSARGSPFCKNLKDTIQLVDSIGTKQLNLPNNARILPKDSFEG